MPMVKNQSLDFVSVLITKILIMFTFFLPSFDLRLTGLCK